MIHAPEDMTVTVDASVTLTALQTALAKSHQWLPLDPPDSGLTLREILDRNESGPRRFGYGMARDYVIGLKVALADGRIIKSGGQVVKNVAGYDLQKLFIGSGGTLGTICEVTFKLRPLPESERCVQQQLASLEAAGAGIEAVVQSQLTPVVFDLHRSGADVSSASVPAGVPPAETTNRDGRRDDGRRDACPTTTWVLGFDGAREDVEWQLALAAKLGFTQPATLDYDKSFRADAQSLKKLSVVPSKLIETLRAVGDAAFVARAGNGVIYHRAAISEASRHLSPVTRHLQQRLKDAFDPKHLLPELPA